MKKLFFKYYIELHKIINQKLDIKHIIQYFIGIIAGAIGLYSLIYYDLVTSIIILIGFSAINQLFHKLFKKLPMTRIMIKTDDMSKEDFKKEIRDVIQKDIEQKFNNED
ncbi:MAG: hypothetical protein ACOCZZ_01215 [Bacillota bacterium]